MPDNLGVNLDSVPEEKLKLFAHLLERAGSTAKADAAQADFLDFVKVVWPEFIGGMHHSRMAAAFKRIATGESKRLIVNMPPRHTKSEFSSYLLPAWLIGLARS